MAFEHVWREVRERAAALAPEEVVVTPLTERSVTVVEVDSDRIVVSPRRDEREHVLDRDQFQVLHDRFEDTGELPLEDLLPGVEPYVSLLSLAPRYAVHDDRLVVAGEATEESPFRRPAAAVRTPPERLRDDAVLLVDALDRYDLEAPGSLDVEPLVDGYVLCSDVQRGADDLRGMLGDALLDRVGPEGRLRGRFGTVTRTVRHRRQPKDDETVFAALDEAGVPREWVLGVDAEKLDVVVSVTDVDEETVYDVDEQVYVQKTGVAEEEKRARLEGLRDRLAALEGEEAEAVREELDELEERIESLLAT
jgi:hypothetical protein